MSRLHLPFSVASPKCDEDALKKEFEKQNTSSESSKELCAFLAQQKALSLKEEYPESYIIGSDQSLFLGSQVFGKSKNEDNAIEQLLQFSGSQALLLTAVYIAAPKAKDSHAFEDHCKIEFKELNKDEIKRYIQLDQPFDCAGSFKIESYGINLFKSMECKDPSAIEGLPLIELSNYLRSQGLFLSRKLSLI